MRLIFFNSNDEKFDIVKSIRYEVFEKEQCAIMSQEIDEYDLSDDTFYLLVYDKDKPVATGRLAKTHAGYKIGRIAVLKSERGKGTGAALVNALCDKAYSLGAECIFVDAQLHAIPFYEKLGFTVLSEKIIIDRGIEHMPMRK